ncbi:hypothetical protein [Halorubrum halodurans]|uniref:Uncharacterized protein n=1 Tax=Halorubrum halodurans TaxID=1383851 RepID=A0A256IJY4_9EURY|nr:hypothetical protein [Halorubrum halodurans]OYR56472.1 hypothetical protein DJ70_08530 [Halorubrum halodurans]
MVHSVVLQLSEVWSYILTNPGSTTQIALSAALVVVTVAYTYFTKQQTDEMADTREMSNQPVVRGGITNMFPTSLVVEITNTGNAAAHDLHATLDFADTDDDPQEFRMSILQPGESYELGFPLDDDKPFTTNMHGIESKLEERDSGGILHVDTEFESPFGTEYEEHEEIEYFDVVENMSQIIRDSNEDKIVSAVEGIEDELGTANTHLEEIGKTDEQKERERQKRKEQRKRAKRHQNVLETVQEASRMEFGELVEEIGEPPEDVAESVRYLDAFVSVPDDAELPSDEEEVVEWTGRGSESGSVDPDEEGEIDAETETETEVGGGRE